MPVTSAQIEEVKAEFKQFDKNNDGKLSKAEYYKLLRTADKSDQKHLKAFFFALRPDEKGAIVFDELVNLMNDAKDGHIDKLKTSLAANLLKHYDRNHDGQITLKEFKRIANDFDLNDDVKTEDLFRKLDENKNNKVTPEELLLRMADLFGL